MLKNTGSDLELDYKPVIETMEDWENLKSHAEKELEAYFSDKQIEAAYGHLAEGHDRGDYSIRLNIEGFFWVPRELLGIEAHMYAFYDEPELLHAINDYILEIYRTKLLKVIDLVQPDVIYFMEDLSGKNGPMVSPDCFEEFVGRLLQSADSAVQGAWRWKCFRRHRRRLCPSDPQLYGCRS